METTALSRIEKGHQMYREGRYDDALGFYTEALSIAKTNGQKIALHSNRAACFLKLHNFHKAAEECTSVLELDKDHTGALMLRAQTLVTLREYQSALFDVNRLVELNPSSEIYQNLYARLKTQLSLATIPESEAEIEEEDEEKLEAEPSICEQEKVIREDMGVISSGKYQKAERNGIGNTAEAGIPEIEKHCIKESTSRTSYRKLDTETTPPAEVSVVKDYVKKPSEKHSNGWQAIPKPKGHSTLNYARWDMVANDLSEDDDDEDDDEEYQPQYRFRVRTVGIRPVKQ